MRDYVCECMCVWMISMYFAEVAHLETRSVISPRTKISPARSRLSDASRHGGLEG